jgi:16S rRNA (uracil1498-N3)-methyltransferase
MTKQRFFIPVENISQGRVIFPPALQSQLSRVLRFKSGAEVEVLDNQGAVFQVRLNYTQSGSWVGEILSSAQAVAEPRVRLALLFGLTQRDKVEWILQKGTEIGVSAFHPFISRRTLSQKSQDNVKRAARWQAILREAAEQSGRGRIPELVPPQNFKQALSVAARDFDLTLAAWEEEAGQDLKNLPSLKKSASIALFCGPEGGFDPLEIALMADSGVQFFTLGRRVLRMETAAILAPALVLYELGEMGLSK